jgi:hypothetical protein
MTDEAEAHRWQPLAARLQLRRIRELPTDEERSAARRRVHELYLRRLRRRRVWRRRVHSIDPGKPPLTVLRWASVLGLAIAWWAAGAKTSPPRQWVPYVIAAAALTLPDIAGLAIGGFRVDLKRTQDEVAALKLRLDVRQTQTTELHLHGAPRRVFEQSLGAELGEQAARNEDVALIDAGTEGEVPS